MNSPDAGGGGGRDAEVPGGSGSDRNANTSSETTTAASKGAIPKRVAPKNGHQALPKKALKLNNNSENMPQMNCVADKVLYNKPANGYKPNQWELPDECYDCMDTEFGPRYNNDLANWTSKNDSDSCSDDDDTELLSVSDDGCIYTYKADYLADLPKSFFNLEIPETREPPVAIRMPSGKSSPEMDFLEMDFDPEPDSASERCKASSPEPTKIIPAAPAVADVPATSSSASNDTNPGSYETMSQIVSQFYEKHNSRVKEEAKPEAEACWLSSDEDADASIWTEQEALANQMRQIGPSSCGATAVLHVLNALRLPLPTTEEIQEMVGTRFRANGAPLAEYLMSRSVAGCNHRDLIRGLYRASGGQVYCRFFAMYPARSVDLKRWLGYWLRRGAVPIATLNLQKKRTEGEQLPDSWHHQMIYGVNAEGVQCATPPECADAEVMAEQLCSESVLLIRRRDVLSRFDVKRGLLDLMRVEDVRWKDMNVVGQIANMIREGRRSDFTSTSHIRIPADYKSGITLAMDVANPALNSLEQCAELPLVDGDGLTDGCL